MVYQYCPKCGQKYINNLGKEDYYKCDFCQFIFYNNPKPVVNGFIIRPKDGALLLVQRGTEPCKGCWGIPGGFVSYGEYPEDALKRELKEELNAEIKVGNIVGTYNEFYNNKGRQDECYSVIVLVYAVTLSEYSNIYPSDDVESIRFFTKDQMPERVAFKNQKFFLNQLMREYPKK